MTATAATKLRARPRPRAQRRSEALRGYLFILPWLAGFVIFTAGPILAGVYYSFTNYPITKSPTWAGLANYIQIVGDPEVGKSLFNTVYFTVLFVPLGVALALALALLLNQNVRWMPLFRTAFYMPNIVPVVASAALWLWLLQPRFGLINVGLRFLGIIGPDWLVNAAWTKPSLILMSLWTVGGGMVIFLAGLQGVPQHLYEAAEIDGAGRWMKFWNVTWPMLSPTTFFITILTVISSFQIFTQAYILGNQGEYAAVGGPLDSLLFYVLYIYVNGFYYFKMGYASALAWVLFLIVLAFTIIQFGVAGRWVYYEVDEKR
jgi:multiple sugar transport system permease protein